MLSVHINAQEPCSGWDQTTDSNMETKEVRAQRYGSQGSKTVSTKIIITRDHIPISHMPPSNQLSNSQIMSC